MSRFAPPTFQLSGNGALPSGGITGRADPGAFASGGRMGGITGAGGAGDAGFGALAAGGEKRGRLGAGAGGGGGGTKGAGFGACSFAAGTAGTGGTGTNNGDALCAAAAARGFRLAAIWAMLQRSLGSRSRACWAMSRNGCGSDSGAGVPGCPVGTRCVSTSMSITPSDQTSLAAVSARFAVSGPSYAERFAEDLLISPAGTRR